MPTRRTTKGAGATRRPRAGAATSDAPRAERSSRREASRQLPDELARVPQQERGQRRMDSILDAAERVFVELGVDAASTSAIAERAGASVGSIYHFFPSKDAILLALATRYAERMREVNARAMPLDAVHLPVEEIFDRIIDGHERSILEMPAFGIVTDATTRKYGSCAVADKLDAAIMGQVRSFLEHRLPKLSAARREAATRLSVSTIGDTVESSLRLPRGERDLLLRELKDMMVRYFAPLDRDFGPPKRVPREKER